MGGALGKAGEHRASRHEDMADAVVIAHEFADRVQTAEPHKREEFDLPALIPLFKPLHCPTWSIRSTGGRSLLGRALRVDFGHMRGHRLFERVGHLCFELRIFPITLGSENLD